MTFLFKCVSYRSVSEEIHPFELSQSELQNIPKTIDKLRGLLRFCDPLSIRVIEYRRKLKKAIKIQSEREFDNQFLK